MCTASCYFRALLLRKHVQFEMPPDLLYHARGCGEVGQPGNYSGATSVRVCELLYRQAASRQKYHRTQIPLAWSKAHTLDGGCELPDPHVRLCGDTLSCVTIATTGMPVFVSTELGDVIPQSGREKPYRAPLILGCTFKRIDVPRI